MAELGMVMLWIVGVGAALAIAIGSVVLACGLAFTRIDRKN